MDDPKPGVGTEPLPDFLDSVTRENLTQLHDKVDAFFEKTRAAYPSSFQCGEGCSMCCHQNLSVSTAEMAWLLEGLAALDKGVLARLEERVDSSELDGDICPLLEDDRCVAYGFRPLICRSHGLPIRVKEEAGDRRDVCPLNFEGKPSLEDVNIDHVLDVERANQLLALINHLSYGEERGGARFTLREALARFFREDEISRSGPDDNLC